MNRLASDSIPEPTDQPREDSIPEPTNQLDEDQIPEPTDKPRGHQRRIRVAVALASIAVGVGIIAGVPDVRHAVSLALQGNFGGLRGYIRGLGVGGLALLMALMLIHALIFYPSEIVTATAGYVYGFLPGLGFVMLGWLVSALLAFVLGRTLGRPLLRTVLGSRS